jgi:hypothetical protein
MGEDGSNMFIHPPACRSDSDIVGSSGGRHAPTGSHGHGLDFAAWVSRRAMVRGRWAGMYLGDRGGDMKIQVQLLSENASRHRAEWDLAAPGLYRAIEKIPTNRLRVVYSGDATLKAD